MSRWKVEHTDTRPTLKAIQSILAAARFAAEKHVQQKRKGIAAEPYVNHLIEVAQIVSDALSEDLTPIW